MKNNTVSACCGAEVETRYSSMLDRKQYTCTKCWLVNCDVVERPTPTPTETVSDLQLKLSKDGDMWSILWGRNLQDGVCGFGKYIDWAKDDFIKSFFKEFFVLTNWFAPKDIVKMFDDLETEVGEEEWEKYFQDNRDQVLDQYYFYKELL